MSRYFTEESNGGMSEEVYSISKSDTNHAIKIRGSVMKEKREEFHRKKDELFYAKRKKKKAKDKFPGRAPINVESLEKHQYSEAINPKRFKSKQTIFKIKKQVGPKTYILAHPDTGSSDLDFQQPVNLDRLVPCELTQFETPTNANEELWIDVKSNRTDTGDKWFCRQIVLKRPK